MRWKRYRVLDGVTVYQLGIIGGMHGHTMLMSGVVVGACINDQPSTRVGERASTKCHIR